LAADQPLPCPLPRERKTPYGHGQGEYPVGDPDGALAASWVLFYSRFTSASRLGGGFHRRETGCNAGPSSNCWLPPNSNSFYDARQLGRRPAPTVTALSIVA